MHTLESKYIAYNAKLILEDGSLFTGVGFGHPCDEIAGEIVFNTGMVGYTEAITDPSYRGQILCMTYPLIGNYGVPSYEIKDEFGLPKYFESDKIQIKGLLIHDLSRIASHWSCIKTLDEWLYEEGIPGIFGIDTRELTKKLRVKGVMNGALSVSKGSIDNVRLSNLAKSEYYEGQNFMPEVSVNQRCDYGINNNNNECIVLLDTGTKYSIIRNIVRIGYRVIRLPWDTPYEKIKSYEPQGVVISNGPGDPKLCKATVNTATELIENSIPTLGICLGNQILALAGGADTYKLKFGHRGQNKPCIDLRSNQTYITSQNHGYGIDPKNLDRTGFRIWFSNIDDNTIEGIEHESKPIIAVQFHPEASPGPNDCLFIFNRFKEIINDFNRTDKLNKTSTILTKHDIKTRKRRKIAKR
ncbi:MAG TPA: glutamine-hydrolyzing carbamoyl-phosphate synthase small subunit [Nitrososphaeraceae archaeon]|nr:glutamine-hydrolyzing carbamoyl-phosphate synthase small subunit [Nitrososphaeraceae archaeon]